jgi:hypothetical protein
VLRLFVLSQLLLFQLCACSGAFALCIDKINDSHALENNTPNIVVENHKRIVFSQTQPDGKILKYDPFLSLYLVEDTQNFQFPFVFDAKLQKSTAILNTKEVKRGRFLQEQIGLNTFAHYSKSLPTKGIVLNSCCMLEGISTPRGVIQKAYLEHFLQTDTAEYGDIGIRVKDENHLVIVNASDPFMPKNPFKSGDCITAFDGEAVTSAGALMQKILFSKVSSQHTVVLKRSGKVLKFPVATHKRYGGGYLSDTFFESQGLYFDNQLSITRLSKAFQAYGIRVGDRLLQVDAVPVNNQEQLRLYLEQHKEYTRLLFERDNFDFFVKIK